MIYKCPVCNEGMKIEDKRIVCENNHSFDQAKQGYFNLLLNSSSTKIQGDSHEMLMARKDIFLKGFYQVVSDELNKIVKKVINDKDVLLDIGSGVGYYLNRLEKYIGENNNFIGIDISKDGIKSSMKGAKNTQYIVGSNSKLPLLNDSIDVITNVFSPLYENECIRVLKNNGYLILVHPNQDHLMELKRVIYHDIILKIEERNALVEKEFIKLESTDVKYNVLLNNEDLRSILLMTPHFWKCTTEGKNRLYNLDELNVGINVRIDVYKIMKVLS